MPTITLTLPSAAYLGDIQRCAADPRVSRTGIVPHPYPSDGAERWLEKTRRLAGERKSSVFLVLAEGFFCGVMSLNGIDWKTGRAELDYWIAGDYQGLGIGTEAVYLTLQRARWGLGLQVLFSGCLAANPASGRILEKNGFQEVGRVSNDGSFGQKFLQHEMRRFRKNLVSAARDIADPQGVAQAHLPLFNEKSPQPSANN
jgi:RimJ/RimL family protein N-acetyltransferase